MDNILLTVNNINKTRIRLRQDDKNTKYYHIDYMIKRRSNSDTENVYNKMVFVIYADVINFYKDPDDGKEFVNCKYVSKNILSEDIEKVMHALAMPISRTLYKYTNDFNLKSNTYFTEGLKIELSSDYENSNLSEQEILEYLEVCKRYNDKMLHEDENECDFTPPLDKYVLFVGILGIKLNNTLNYSPHFKVLKAIKMKT